MTHLGRFATSQSLRSLAVPHNLAPSQVADKKTLTMHRRLQVMREHSELERQRARVSSARRDLMFQAKRERARKLRVFQERMTRHQKEHQKRVEEKRLRELERLSKTRKNKHENRRTRKIRKKEIHLRFVDAMRVRLSEQMKRAGYGVVPLCGCTEIGDDEIIPNWTECANNCEFYNNPEKFHKAVKSMFASIHEVERNRYK